MFKVIYYDRNIQPEIFEEFISYAYTSYEAVAEFYNFTRRDPDLVIYNVFPYDDEEVSDFE